METKKGQKRTIKVVIVDEDTTFLKMWEKIFRLMNFATIA